MVGLINNGQNHLKAGGQVKLQTFAQLLVVGTTVSSGQTVIRAVAGMLFIASLPAPILTAFITALCVQEEHESMRFKTPKLSTCTA